MKFAAVELAAVTKSWSRYELVGAGGADVGVDHSCHCVRDRDRRVNSVGRIEDEHPEERVISVEVIATPPVGVAGAGNLVGYIGSEVVSVVVRRVAVLGH